MEAKQIVLTLLPSVDDDSTIYKNFVTFVQVSCVRVEHLPFFEHSFNGVVSWHTHVEQRKHKCDVVSIAVYGLKTIALWIRLPIRRL